MSKTALLAKISQKHEKNAVFEKNQSFLGKMALFANLSQNHQKKAFFEKKLIFLNNTFLQKMGYFYHHPRFFYCHPRFFIVIPAPMATGAGIIILFHMEQVIPRFAIFYLLIPNLSTLFLTFYPAPFIFFLSEC